MLGSAVAPSFPRYSPSTLRRDREPIGSLRIAIVRVVAEFLIQLRVLLQLLAIHLDAETGPIRHFDGAVDVFHLSAADYVVREMVIVRIGREGKVRDRRTEMEHRCELNT